MDVPYVPFNIVINLIHHINELEYRKVYAPLLSAYSTAKLVNKHAEFEDFFPPWGKIVFNNSNIDEEIGELLKMRLLSQEMMELIGLERVLRIARSAG